MAEKVDQAASIQGFLLDVDGVLSDGRLYYGESGELMKSFHVRDGLGLAMLRECGLKVGILSGRESPVVRHRAKELGIEPILLGRRDKAASFREVCEGWGLPASAVATIGDDLVDLPMLVASGMSFAPADADPRVLSRVDHACTSRGGHGAVREACEIILQGRGFWARWAKEFKLDENS